MDGRSLGKFCVLLSSLALVGCMSSSSDKTRISAPLPPLSDSVAMAYGDIQPAAGHPSHVTVNASPQNTSCRFSSFHRKHTLGYEFDEQSHLSFTASPSFDAFGGSDFDVKIGLRFTKALGGAAKKRPKCTYSGYYGLLPYAMNNDINVSGLMDKGYIKSYIEERLDERERRRKEREEKLNPY